MTNLFFEKPVLNSPYDVPARHWELDATGQPTQEIRSSRRRADFITPIPKPRKQKGAMAQGALLFDEGLSTPAQQYHAGIINGVRRPGSKKFTRGFLIVAPGITIKDRLRVLQPNDPDSYYQSRELVPADLLADLGKARIVITNYLAFKRRERMDLSKGGRLLLQGRGGEALAGWASHCDSTRFRARHIEAE